MTEEEIIDLIPEYLEGILDPELRLAVEDACQHNPNVKTRILEFKEMTALLNGAAFKDKLKLYHEQYLESRRALGNK
jgi:anti-sigma factor RsiW